MERRYHHPVLKRILASLAITSLLLAGVLLVYWYRSNHGYIDGFTLGKSNETQSHFTSAHGRIALEVTQHLGAAVMMQTQFYPFQNVIAYCLILPALWLAVTIRNWLPRPPGREARETRRTKSRLQP
jgi:hypothetical protein